MQRCPGRILAIAASLLALLYLTGFAYGKRKPADDPPFQYLGGTENLPSGCGGRLEILRDSLAFTCTAGSVNMPFTAITLMQYRPNLSKQVSRMNIPWKVQPQLGRVKDNEYLTILYNEQGTVHGLVLKVDPPDMRPYLAEIELRSGKSVQVYRSYDEVD